MFRAALIQVVPNSKLANIQKKQFNKTVKISARRGAIFDRNKKELAATVSSYSIYVDPSLIKKNKKVSRLLAKTLKMPYSKVYRKVKNKKKRFVWVKRRVGLDLKQKIQKLNLRGVGLLEEPKRIYPNGNLLSQTLGFVGIDDQGLEGLERKLDKELKGEVQRLSFNRDAWGRPLLLNNQYFTSHKDGEDQILTIDSELQFKLENELENAVERFQADSAVGVILDVESFEVLSLASVPTYNLSRPFGSSALTRRNRAITDSFEPGSTMKTFIVAGAISSRTVEPNTKIDCEDGKFKIGRRTIREADSDHNFGVLTVEEIIANSSNIGSSKIALKMGTKKVKKVLREFGFGQKTNIQFPGESKGIIKSGSWPRHTLATVSFGHGITTTPIQMAAAYASIANGGVLKEPILVKGTVDATGRVQENKSKVVRRVLSKEDATTMRLMLMSATGEDYSGFNARIHGFPVAGKTGTAQKVSKTGGYARGEYIASFAGFVPAHDPKFVIYIAVDNPKLKYYGSQVAAPVFSKVASYAVLKAGLPPVLLSKNDIIDPKVLAVKKSKKKNLGAKAKPIRRLEKMPLLEGLSLREVYQKISGQDLKIKVRGSGRVVKTWPGPGDKLSKSRKVKVQLKQSL